MNTFRSILLSIFCGTVLLVFSSQNVLGYACSDLTKCSGAAPNCTLYNTISSCTKEASDSPICNCPNTTQYIHCLEGSYKYENCCPYWSTYIGNMGSGKCTRSINSTYPNGGTCTCCTQINCTCTPSCPSGSSFTNTGSLCYAGKSSCSQSNSCSECTEYGAACYTPETNTSFVQNNGSTAGPTSVSMKVDGTTYTLSTNPSSPTIIKLPACSSPNVQITTPTFSPPATSRGDNYYFVVNNYGVNNQWVTGTTCNGGTAGEDFCTTTSTSNTRTFAPVSLTVNQVLKEGAVGQISAFYATQNKCNDNYQYSTARVGYYKVETVEPSVDPTSVSMIVEGTTFNLSSSASTPTRINLPSLGTSDVQVSVPTFTAPASSRGAYYKFLANNFGVNSEWKNSTVCGGGTIGEDFCRTTASNTQTFDPTSTSLTVNDVLKNGARGLISVAYATLDKCTDTFKYSNVFNGYYLVNSRPLPGPDPVNIFPDIATDVTTKGCSSTTYTGLDINNPLHVVMNATDADSIDEIQAFVLWFSKDTSKPATGTTTGTYSGSSNQDLGIMIKKNGTSWSSPYIYTTNGTTSQFARPSSGYIKVNGANIARIYDVSVTQDTDVTADYKIEFLADSNNLSGEYNIYAEALDSYMINGSNMDLSYLSYIRKWGIDLVNPVANDIVQEIYDSTSAHLTWGVSDVTSGIVKTILNAYRVGGSTTDNVSLSLPTAYTTSKGSITLQTLPSANSIGNYAGTNAWVFTTSTGEKDKINIGSNELGSIEIYATTYDKACNVASTNESIDLNPWFATRGGVVYSENNISTTAKDVSSVTSLDNTFSTKAAMTKEKIDLGTELLSTRNVNISNLIHPTAGAVRSLVMYDMNNSKNYWFSLLIDEFDQYKTNAAEFIPTTTSVSADCTEKNNCYYISTSAEADIHIPSAYICDKPTLIISNRDIYIEPNVVSGSGLSGCIFLAKNNIYIDDASYLSGTKINYDYLEGFFIADNQIIFSLVDQVRTRRDGVEIYGGLLAFGSNITSGNAITINRNLRLYNQTNPTLVVTYDNKYSNISTLFFGQQASIYKQELGFKTY